MNEDPEDREAWELWAATANPIAPAPERAPGDRTALLFATVFSGIFLCGLLKESWGQEPNQLSTFVWGTLAGIAILALLLRAQPQAQGSRSPALADIAPLVPTRRSPPAGRATMRPPRDWRRQSFDHEYRRNDDLMLAAPGRDLSDRRSGGNAAFALALVLAWALAWMLLGQADTAIADEPGIEAVTMPTGPTESGA